MRKTILIVGMCLIALAGAGCWYALHRSSQPLAAAPVTHDKPAPVRQPAVFDKRQYSLTDPASIWVIVNKQHPLTPTSYAPADLRFPAVSLATPGANNMLMQDVTASAIERMFTDARQINLKLQIISGYRSYSYQVSVYNGYVKSVGQTTADSESARPGYSEHQSGLAVDIQPESGQCSLQTCFGSTPEAAWLAGNAYKYGFILRYPADKVDITGYMYEPWHYRYVGTALAVEMHNKNVGTLEEFFGVSGGTSY